MRCRRSEPDERLNASGASAGLTFSPPSAKHNRPVVRPSATTPTPAPTFTMTERLTESRQSRHSYSRPASSLGRAGSAMGSYAPSSSTYGLGPKTPRSSAARFGGLQEKEIQKASGTMRERGRVDRSRELSVYGRGIADYK